MSSQGDDQDTVRAKRVAKLSTSAPSPAPPKPEVSPAPVPRAETETFQTLVNKDADQVTQKIPPPPPPTSKSVPLGSAVMTLEEWEDEAISKIMLVTLDPEKPKQDHEYIFLQTILDDLAEQGQEPRLSVGNLESTITARADLDDTQTPFHYLLGAWKRAVEMSRTIRVDRDKRATEKNEILTEVRRLCVSYSVFSLTMPDMFSDALQEHDLCSYFMQDIFTDIKLPEEFLNELAKQSQDEGLINVIGSTINGIGDEIASVKFNESKRSAMTFLVQCKPIAAIMPEMPNWIPTQANPSGAIIEQSSILGRFFALSPIALGVPPKFFKDPRLMTPVDKLSMSNSLQEAVRQYQDGLHKICHLIIKSGNTGRRGVLDWFSAVLAQNQKRKAMQVDPATVASDGFMYNVVSVLNRFAAPFVDIQGSKIDRVDVDYFRTIPVGRTTSRIVLTDETKLKADNTTAEEYLSHRIKDVEPHFISEIFFLNCYAHNIGLGPAMQTHARLENDLVDMQRQVDRINATDNWRSSPHAALFTAALERTKNQIEETASLQATMDALMFDRVSQEKSIDFLRFVASWLLNLVDERHSHPRKTLQLPLKEEVPVQWRCLPQFLFEIITDHLCYIMRAPEIMGDRPWQEFIILALTFIGPSGSAYIQNPHLKAKLAEMLYMGTFKHPRFPYGLFGEILNSDSFALEWTFPCIMSFYIEVEHTGLHSQFYDKFNIRYHLSQVMMCVWNNTSHRKRLLQESKTNVPRFVQFVNLLLNDVTYLLDEGLSKLIEINKLQKELEGQPIPDPMPQQLSSDRREREQHLATTERQATSYISLANETVSLLVKFTAFVPDAFIYPEVVDRLARMLNFNQVVLTGDKCNHLKVKNPDKYRFSPGKLLSMIVDIYLNLRMKQGFITACARDGRSYRREVFMKTTIILRKYTLKSPSDIEEFEKFVDAVEEAKQQDEEGEEALGDIPEHFLDPLMYTIMEDPVILPTSKVSIDLATIKSHLLSDPTDPFNRSPLKIEDVVPNHELKAEISKFRKEKRAKKTKTE